MRFKGEALKAERDGAAQVCPHCGIKDKVGMPEGDIDCTWSFDKQGTPFVECYCMVCEATWNIVYGPVKVEQHFSEEG